MKNLVKTFESFDHNSELGNIEIEQESHHEVNHYMFFGNLETIKRYVDAMLKMDPTAVNELLDNGHDWAADHIATSKDDIEEVANFLMNEMHEALPSEHQMFDDDESDESNEYVGENYSCNECGMTYAGEVYEDGYNNKVCEACGGTVTQR